MRRLVGLEEAVTLAAMGETIDPEAAERVGLVDRIVPFENLMAAAIQIQEQQAEKSNPIDPRRIFEWADARIRNTFAGHQAIAPLKALQIMRNGMMHGEVRERDDERQAMVELRHLPHPSGGAHA
jgi:enoyl-CoA hydratase/carnithine racemase